MEPQASCVSIRFKVRGGFRLLAIVFLVDDFAQFQSALRFAVVSDAMVVGLGLIGA